MVRRRPVLAAFLCASGLALTARARAQSLPDPAIFRRDAARHATIRAVRVAEPLRIDGVLDEAIYRDAPPIEDFIQSLPHEGAPASERTEAWVMFDGDNLYLAARCWDSTGHWIANEMRRDSVRLGDNDGFGFMLDTFNDHRNGVSFATTPLGARMEAQLTNEGSANLDWNVVWHVRPGRFDGGWTVEIAVPFTSLRYRPGLAQTWGIQLRRLIRHKNEWLFINPVPAQTAYIGLTRVSLAAALVGLDLPPTGNNLEVKPYVTGRVATDRLQVPAVEREPELDAGLDVKYGITNNLTADFTYHTDFAQVEVDEQQVNLTRFNLVFPEKREFFLEGRGIFEFGRPGAGLFATPDVPAIFYSRRIGLEAGRIVPIDLGGRLTGKAGGFSMGVLSMRTADQPVFGAPSTNFTVARVSRDVLRRSTIGAIATHRSRAAGGIGSNQAYGVDGAFSFFQDLTMNAFWARTRTAGRVNDDVSYMGRAGYGGDRYGARAEYLAVGRNFNPEIGFLRRTDFRRAFASGRFSPRPTASARVRKLTWDGSTEFVLNGAGDVESSQHTGHFDVEFSNSDRLTVEANRNLELLVRPFAIARGVTLPIGEYGFSDAMASYTLGQQRKVSGTLTWQQGEFYNGTITTLGYTGGRVSLTRHLSFDPSISINRVRLPAGNFTTRLVRARTDYAFTPWMFASALLQYNSADRSFSSNLRFRWEYQPGSEFFAVYTDEHDMSARGFGSLKNRALVLKINRLVQF